MGCKLTFLDDIVDYLKASLIAKDYTCLVYDTFPLVAKITLFCLLLFLASIFH